MRIPKPVVNYLDFRPNKLNTDEFRHLKLLFFWPAYGLLFMFVERFYQVPGYCPMACAMDGWIPFNEWFLLPYFLWFVTVPGMLVYLLFYDLKTYRRYMWFIIFTYSTAILTYLIFPTCQQLRPASFERDNLLTRVVAHFYEFDTNTNVCPSIHVIGAIAVLFASWEVKPLRTPGWKAASMVVCVLICLSTVFLKQHSVLDILAALPVCLGGYLLCFRDAPAPYARRFKAAETPIPNKD